MSERTDRSKDENIGLIEGRIFAAVIGLGGEIPQSGFDAKKREALEVASSGSSKATLRRSLVLDLGFANRTNLNIRDNFKDGAINILKKKGGE